MAPHDARSALIDSLETCLELLQDFSDSADGLDPDHGESLDGLADQCTTLARQHPAPDPFRFVHHFACTGGTLICKALAAMPNTTLLSEIDPLSTLGLPHRNTAPQFRPTDMIFAGRVAARPISDSTAQRMGVASICAMQKSLVEEGRHLCIRVHSHSQYCSDIRPDGRPGVQETLAEIGPALGVVTVRHPIESFLSVRRNGWIHFRPDSVEEYARRYLLFLDDHRDLQIFKYEDFVNAPDPVLKQICDALALPFAPGTEALLPIIHLSGDSGRSSDQQIAPRPRRAVSDELVKEISESTSFVELCARLDYNIQVETAG